MAILERKNPPPFKVSDNLSFQQAEHILLPNGIPVFYINSGSQAVMRIEVIFNTGSSLDENPAIPSIVAESLTEGTNSYSGDEISRLLAGYGAYINTQSGFDRTVVEVYLMNKHLGQIGKILKEIITVPVFPENEISRIKKEQVSQLLVNLERTSFVATREFRARLFRDYRGYGKIITKEDIKSIDAASIIDFFGRRYGKPTIVLSGLIDEEALHNIRESFGDLTFNSNRLSRGLKKLNYSPTKKYISKSGSSQSSIRLGMPCPGKTDPDYWKYRILITALGGYFGSRLMKSIREEKGLTYGIYAQIAHLEFASYLQIGADVKKKNRKEAVSAIKDEMVRLQTDLMDVGELELLVNYMKGSYQTRLNSPFALADHFKSIHFHGLNYNFFDRFFEEAKMITPEIIQDMAKKYWDIDALTEVVVG